MRWTSTSRAPTIGPTSLTSCASKPAGRYTANRAPRHSPRSQREQKKRARTWSLAGGRLAASSVSVPESLFNEVFPRAGVTALDGRPLSHGRALAGIEIDRLTGLCQLRHPRGGQLQHARSAHKHGEDVAAITEPRVCAKAGTG